MKPLYVRLPDEIHEQLVKLAEQERRSLNSQIVYLLEQALKQSSQSSTRAQEHEGES